MFVIAGAALTISMLLTVGDVILRMFRRPILGTYELVGLLGAIVVAFALPQTSRLKGHVLMDFITGRLSAGANKFLYAITRILGIGLFAVLGWNLYLFGNDFRRVGEVTPTLQIPLYPIAYAVSFCAFVVCIVLFAELFTTEEQPS